MPRSLETRQALFRAALVAQCAAETHVTTNRIAAALLRTAAVRELCARAQIDPVRLFDAVDDPGALSFEQCERIVTNELARDGVELGSREHQERVQLRPMEPVVREVLDRALERHGRIDVSPPELLRDLIGADRRLAERLAPHGLSAAAFDVFLGAG